MAIFRLGRIGLVTAVAAVIAAPLSLLVGAGTSGADTSPPTGGWYWAGQPGAQPAPVGQPPAVPTPDVPAGDLAAGYRPTGVDKETFLHLAGEVGSGTSVTSVVLTIKEDGSAGNVAADQGKVNARPVSDFWLDGAAGTSIDQAPKFEDTPSVAGTRAADGTWTFDLTPIAQLWANGTPNNGVALVPDQSGGTFQVVWKLDTGAVAVQSSGGSSSDLTVGGSADATGSGGSATSTGTSGGSSGSAPDSGSTSSFSGSGSSSPSLGGDVSTFSPATDTPAPSTATAPATPATTAPAGRPEVALDSRTKKAGAHRGLPVGFFLAALVTLAVLGGIGVTLGDLGEPDVPREGSVVRRLERRVAPIR